MTFERINGACRCAIAGIALVATTVFAQDEIEIQRDPFRPFNLRLQPSRADVPRTPLERYDVGSLSLVAILQHPREPVAMVEDDAGLGFTVRRGDRIGQNRGVVTEIRSDGIVIEEETLDFYGEPQQSTIELRLRPEEEGSP